MTGDAYWRDQAKMKKTYQDKEGEKRPVWVVGADGADARVIEVLRYQCVIDGSRAVWKPK